jgi:hypothetical protein
LGFEEEVEAQGRGGGGYGVPGFGDVAEGEDGFCWEVGEGVFEEFGGGEDFGGCTGGAVAGVLMEGLLGLFWRGWQWQWLRWSASGYV